MQTVSIKNNILVYFCSISKKIKKILNKIRLLFYRDTDFLLEHLRHIYFFNSQMHLEKHNRENIHKGIFRDQLMF